MNISFNGIFSSFNENRKKKYNRLQKSVNSVNTDYSDFTFENYANEKEILFTDIEVQAAIKRLNKNEGHELKHWFLDQDIDHINERENIYSKYSIDKKDSFAVRLFKTICGILLPDVHYIDSYKYNEIEMDCSNIYMSEDLMAELYFRKAERILSNILSKIFDKRKLITVQAPINISTYKYFDLVFSLKKEAVLKSKQVITFFDQHFYLIQHEKTYFRNIPATGRT